MNLASALVALAVVALVARRQLRTARAERVVMTVVAGVLTMIGIAGLLLAPPDGLAGVGLVLLELVVALGLGAFRAATMTVWCDAEGVAWSRGTLGTVVGWVLSLVVRFGLYFLAVAVGLHPHPLTLLLFVGVTLGCQALLIRHRGARAIAAARQVSVAV